MGEQLMFSPLGFLGGGDQAVEVVSLRLPARVHLSPHQQVTHTNTPLCSGKLCCFICVGGASLCYLISRAPPPPPPAAALCPDMPFPFFLLSLI